jgi:hypothetical protein
VQRNTQSWPQWRCSCSVKAAKEKWLESLLRRPQSALHSCLHQTPANETEPSGGAPKLCRVACHSLRQGGHWRVATVSTKPLKANLSGVSSVVRPAIQFEGRRQTRLHMFISQHLLEALIRLAATRFDPFPAGLKQ